MSIYDESKEEKWEKGLKKASTRVGDEKLIHPFNSSEWEREHTFLMPFKAYIFILDDARMVKKSERKLLKNVW